ncbi:MAG TPA: c-type cytochrome domain-containing protein [Gemmataceae bacterium]
MRFCFWISLALLVSSRFDVLAADTKKPAKITFDEHILPLFRDKCIACHNQDKKRAGLVLDNYTKVMEGSSSGVVVKPGDPDGSPLFRVTAHKAEPFMPPKSPMLPPENLDLIEKWIAGGALENAGSKAILANKSKTDIGLISVVRGKPEGPPPMPPKTLPLEPVARSKRGTAILALASSPWAPLVAVGGQKQVLLYHSDTLELLGVLPFPEGMPHVLRFSRNGSLLLAGGGHDGKSGRVVVWSVLKGERILSVGEESDAVLAADISPDQTQIALGGPSKVVRVYSTKDGKLQQEIRKHTDWVTTLEYSPDGVLLATGDRNGGLFVWEAFTAREYFTLRGHTAAIMEVSWRSDSNVCASASEDGTIRLWEMENGGAIKTWGAHGGTQSLRYGRDGRIVSCGRDRTVRLWDGNGAAQRAFDAFGDLALRTTFSHDCGRVIAGDWNGQILVWNTADGKRIGTLSANPPTIAQQLELAVKELDACQKGHDQLTAIATAAQKAAQQATTDLAESQKAVGATAADAKAAKDALSRATEIANRAKTTVEAGQAEGRAKELLAQALGEAANKVKATADKTPQDKALAAAASKTRLLADQAASELTAARKTLADALAANQKATADLAAAQQKATAAANASSAALKAAETRQVALKTATRKAAADQTALDKAATALAQAKAAVKKWQAALVSTRTTRR